MNPNAEEKTVVFGPAHPTKLVPVLLSEHENELICQKGAFLCGARTTEIELYTTQNFTTGFFGGEGFILQRLTGEGLVILKVRQRNGCFGFLVKFLNGGNKRAEGL